MNFPLDVRRFARLLVLGLILSAGTFCAAASRLTQAQALDAARVHILSEEKDVMPAALTNYEVVALDPLTWGENYFAFRFPALGSSDYHVSKESGSVHMVLSFTVTVPAEAVSGSITSILPHTEATDLYRQMPTLTKIERWSDYLITVSFPEALGTDSEDLGFACMLWEPSSSVPPYHHQEHRLVLKLKRANQVGSVVFLLSKADAQRFPIIDLFLQSAADYLHTSMAIAEIPAPSPEAAPAR